MLLRHEMKVATLPLAGTEGVTGVGVTLPPLDLGMQHTTLEGLEE